MGNWVRVKIDGTCSNDDLPALKNALNIGNDWDKFHCLCNSGGICGLGDWAKTRINAVGNLAERDYDKNSVADQLIELVKVAPSLNVEIHVGGEYESDECVATVFCKDGEVSIEKPRISKIPEISEDQMLRELLSAMFR